VGLGLLGSWFSLRTVRLVTGIVAFILIVTVTQYGLTHSAGTTGDVVGSFLRGIDAVAVALLRPLGGAPAPGTADRWIIAVAVLIGYRQLEAWTRRWQAPELDLSAIGQGQPTMTTPAAAQGTSPGAAAGHGATAAADDLTDAQRHDQLAAELRFRLPAMEIRCPSILPGGSRTNALASIAETSGVSAADMASALIRLAALFWPGPRRIRARVWIEPPVAGPGTRVTVLLEDARTGTTVATKTVTGANLQVAASMTAGYIARQIFAMDRSVPAWCWGLSDGRDLGAWQLARMERVHAACHKDVFLSRDRQISILSNAMGNVRSAGIVRYELAQLCAVSERHLESLRLHALNRELHPRLYRGRYRLAMSLEMIANTEHYLPDSDESWNLLEETLAILSRCGLLSATYDLVSMNECEVTGTSGKPSRHLTVSPDLCLQLLDIAARDLREVRAQLRGWRVVWDALIRRDERPVWLPHWRQQHRQPFQDGVRAAELFIAVRRKLVEREIAYRALWAGRSDPLGQVPSRDRPDGAALGPNTKPKVPKEFRRAVKIASFIVGDQAYLSAVLATALTRPFGPWPTPPSAAARAASRARDRHRAARARDRIRWLPGQRRTASWQAAYNTACLFAALAAAAPEPVALVLEDWVIASLRRAIDNPLSELERPSDWISHDPDFRPLSRDSTIFEKFAQFVADQDRQDYPVAFLAGGCPVSHASQPLGKGSYLAIATWPRVARSRSD
jgi:hypothetical protein